MRRWKIIEDNVKLMLFRDRGYQPQTTNEDKGAIETETTIRTTKPKKRPRAKEHKEGEEQGEEGEERTDAEHRNEPPPPLRATTNDDEKRRVCVLFVKELDIAKWRQIYEQHFKSVDDLIVVAIQIQSIVHTLIERLSYDPENTVRIELFESSSLMNDLLSHRANQQNRPTLLSPLESCRLHRDVLKNAELPVLRTTDIVAKWLGARPNQIVQYDRVSHGVGMSRAFRIVKP